MMAGVVVVAMAVAVAVAGTVTVTVTVMVTVAKPMHYLCSRCKGCLIFMGV